MPKCSQVLQVLQKVAWRLVCECKMRTIRSRSRTDVHGCLVSSCKVRPNSAPTPPQLRPFLLSKLPMHWCCRCCCSVDAAVAYHFGIHFCRTLICMLHLCINIWYCLCNLQSQVFRAFPQAQQDGGDAAMPMSWLSDQALMQSKTMLCICCLCGVSEACSQSFVRT